MIHVLNVISDANIGGAGRCLLNFLKYYDRSKYAVSVALPLGSRLIPEIRRLNTPIYEIPGFADTSFSITATRALRSLIKELRPDVVHTHGAMAGRIAAKGTGAKIVYTRHSAFPVSDRIKKNPGRFLYKTVNEFFSDRIIAVSQACKENLTDGGISEDRITVMLNGVEAVTPVSAEDVRALRVHYNIREDEFVLGIMARIEDYKGHIYILEALRKLVDEGRRVRLIIAGDGDFTPVVRAKCAQLSLSNHVIFAGFVTNVAGVLSIMDLQLNASYGTEASSLAMIEGFSMGLPVVASDYGGNPWMVEQGENGFLFPSRDSAAMAAAIGKLMDDPELYAYMQRRSREIYEERFTGEIFARNVEAVYDRALTD